MGDNDRFTERQFPESDSGPGKGERTSRFDAISEGLQKPSHARRTTERAATGEVVGGGLNLPLDTYIDDRYRIEAGPLAGGNADLYRCTDTETEQELAVKLYRGAAPIHPEAAEWLRGLAHPSIVAMQEIGTWEGRAYEAMEYCAGGTLADRMPLADDDVRGMLPGVVDALEFLHMAGIVHRDVKPTNILFRRPDSIEPVLADFDISSLFKSDDPIVRRTESGGNFTIDYASPELIGDDQIGPKTDFYALGITIAHTLSGHSPFHGMRREQIVAAHLRGTIPLSDNLSAEIRALIGGLTDRVPANRWGAAQVRAWEFGNPIQDDEGRPWQPSAAAPVSYPGFPDARTPRELANHLTEFDAEGELFRTDDIGRWVFDHFDAGLARRIRAISEEFASNRRLGLYKLRYLLNPGLPLDAGRHEIRTLTDLARLIENGDQVTQRDVATMLFSRRLGCWIDAVRPVAEKSDVLVAKLGALRQRVQENDLDLAIFALQHTLDPGRRVKLEPGIEAANPSELGAALARGLEYGRASFENFVFSRKLEEWLCAAEFKEWKADVSFLKDCRKLHSETPEIACFGALSRLSPSLPFPFDNKPAAQPRELAEFIDRDVQTRKLGIDMLRDGWIRMWLVATGRLVDPAPLDQILRASDLSWQSKLEAALLQVLDPTMARPRAKAVPAALDFGDIALGGQRTMMFTIDNVTRGHLAGEAYVVDGASGVSIERSRFEGVGSSVRVTADPAGVALGSRKKTDIIVTTNGGKLTVPVRYRAAAPLRDMLTRSAFFGVIMAMALTFLRALVPDRKFLSSTNLDPLWLYGGPGLAILALLLVWGYWMLRTWRRNG